MSAQPNPLRVVLADDEAAIRGLTKYWLEQDGRFQVVGEARDGAECLEVVKESEPDLVLLDLVMPKVGGLQALPGLRRACPDASIVVLSMLQEEESRRASLSQGADAFLDKGLDNDALIARLIEISGRRPHPVGPQATV